MKLSPAKISAIKTGARSFLATVLYAVLTSLHVPQEFAVSLAVVTPIILKAIDPTFKEYGKGSK